MARKYLYIATLLLLILSSCSDMFSTRDPEDPDPDSEPYTAQSASALILNLKGALLAMDKNLYESILIDPLTTGRIYKFETFADDISAPSIFNDWGIDNEKSFIAGLESDGNSFTDVVFNYEPYDESLDYIELDINYSINLVDSNSTVFSVKGEFTLEMISLDGYFWHLLTWKDNYYDLSVGEISFSKLKEPYVY